MMHFLKSQMNSGMLDGQMYPFLGGGIYPMMPGEHNQGDSADLTAGNAAKSRGQSIDHLGKDAHPENGRHPRNNMEDSKVEADNSSAAPNGNMEEFGMEDYAAQDHRINEIVGKFFDEHPSHERLHRTQGFQVLCRAAFKKYKRAIKRQLNVETSHDEQSEEAGDP